MSEPSFTLFRRDDGLWVARTRVGGKRLEVGCGRGNRTEVERIAAERIREKLGVRNGVDGPPPPGGGGGGGSSGAPAGGDGVAITPPPAPAAESARAAEIRARLRALAAPNPGGNEGGNGGGAPVSAPPPPGGPPSPPPGGDDIPKMGWARIPAEPDKVIAPGQKDDDQEDDDDGGDGEAGELLADVITEAIVTVPVKLTTKALAKAKPPQKPGDPNETMLEWWHDGVQHRMRKLLGRSGTLSPNAKMLIGCAGVCATMWIGATPIEPAAAAAAPPPAAAAAPTPAPTTPAPSSPAPAAAGAQFSEDVPALAADSTSDAATGRFR